MKRKVYKYETFPTIGMAVGWLNQNPRYELASVFQTNEDKIALIVYYIQEVENV